MNGHSSTPTGQRMIGGYADRLEAFRQSDAEREQMVTELLRNFEHLREKYEQMGDDLGNERESRRMWQSKANSSDRALTEQRQASVGGNPETFNLLCTNACVQGSSNFALAISDGDGAIVCRARVPDEAFVFCR